ncbi:MAG TPA: hypoxanthine phosphoribosyltransferase [Candidatus Kapabacteria bacterium]|nr:hypoxanthine phosphoribosyltransferase [Candidatus Kapabacteria bacterium]
MAKEIINIKDKSFKIFIEEAKIKVKVKELAERINKDYEGKSPIILVVLRGALIFGADLFKELNYQFKLSIISAKSYHGELESSGEVKVHFFDSTFENKDIIIVEDIVDTGQTIFELVHKLKLFNPNSIEVASFLSKPNSRKKDVNIKYLGYEIPNYFVIGYGLDYDEQGRGLKDIYSLDTNK